MKIAIVMLTHNSRSTLRQGVIEAILNAGLGHEINFTTVDSGSTDGTINEIRSRVPAAKVVYCPRGNLAACRNLGARNVPLDCEFLCWIDSDIVIPSNFFSRLIPLFEDLKVGSAELRVMLEETASNTLVPRYYRDAWRGPVKGVETIREGGGTNCLIMRNKLAKEILIDERFRAAGEDVALHFEIMKRGHQCLIDLGEPTARHIRPPTVLQEIRRMMERGEARSLNLKIYRELIKERGTGASLGACLFTLSAWFLLLPALLSNLVFSIPLILVVIRQSSKLKKPWIASHVLLGLFMSTAYYSGFFKGFMKHWIASRD